MDSLMNQNPNFIIETIITYGPLCAALLALLWLLTRCIVNIGPTEIGILERRFFGQSLPTGRAFATGLEVGVLAKYLQPGLHFVAWPLMAVIKKVPFVIISSDELGVITAADGETMPSGRIFAEDKAGDHHDSFQDPVGFLTHGGIRGKQLRFLTNGTYKIHPLLFHVQKILKTKIPEGLIGVVTASDGLALDNGQLLGRHVEGHDHFQKAEIFLQADGQKGPQIDFLRPGSYNILTDVFTVEMRKATQIIEDQIGLVEARDGAPMERNEIVASTPDLAKHKGYQDGEAFLQCGGQRGPQETVLRPGTYYINPYLFEVSIRPVTVINQGEVGVLISNIGRDPMDLTEASPESESGKLRHVVPEGYRGIQRNVIGPGKYNLNPLVFSLVKVPTTMRSVEWAQDAQSGFNPFEVVSHDGFEMRVEVRCQYRIQPEDAPYVVQRLGSVAELERNVIHPQIDGIFRAQVSRSPAISYQQNRAVEQSAAENAVRDDLLKYRVDVVSVMITNIHLPEALMRTTQQKNLAEQEESMFDAKKKAEERRIEFEKTKSEADQQSPLMQARIGVEITEHEAKQTQKRAEGEAARIRITAIAEAERTQAIGNAEAHVTQVRGEAQAKAYQDQVKALSAQGVTAVELIKAISAAGLRITPDVIVSGTTGSEGSGGLVQALLAQVVSQQIKTPVAK